MNLALAFAQAQRLLAQAQGMPAGGTNTLYNGATYIGVYGQSEPQEKMNPGGGFRKRTEITLTLTRAQMPSPPIAQTELVRTDLAAAITYRIATVDTQDPIHYVLTLVNVAQ